MVFLEIKGKKKSPSCFNVVCIVVALCSPAANRLPSAGAKYLKFQPINPEHLLQVFYTPVFVFCA